MATKKQKKAVAKMVENGGVASKAMIESGYSEATAKTPQKLTESKGFKELLEQYIPDDELVKIHKEGLHATKLNGVGGMKVGLKKGEFEDIGHADIETPDYPTRHKYLDTAYKIKGSYAPEKTVSFNANVDVTHKIEAQKLAEEYETKLRECILKKHD